MHTKCTLLINLMRSCQCKLFVSFQKVVLGFQKIPVQAQNSDSIKHGLLLVALLGLIRSISGKIDVLMCELLCFSRTHVLSQQSAVTKPSSRSAFVRCSGRCSAVVLELPVRDSFHMLKKNPAVAVDTQRRPSAPAVH